jgi:hypothetical protein
VSIGTTPPVDEHVPEVSPFLSYDRPLRSFAISLASALEAKRVVLRGDWQLNPGADWWDRIADLIAESKFSTWCANIIPDQFAACLKTKALPKRYLIHRHTKE